MTGCAVPFNKKLNYPGTGIHLMAGHTGVKLPGNAVGCICGIGNLGIVEEVMPFDIFVGTMTDTALCFIHIVKKTVIDAD